MIHGLNYPRGILAWADEIGLDHVLAVLDAWRSNARGALPGGPDAAAGSDGPGGSGGRPGGLLLSISGLSGNIA